MRKTSLVFTIIFYVLTFMSLLLVTISSIMIKPIKEEDTYSFDATIKEVKTIYNAKAESDCYHIVIEEYPCELFIAYPNIILNMEEFNKLSAGDTINCKIEKDKKEILENQHSIVYVVYIAKGSNVLISLDSYNVDSLDNYRIMTRVAAISTAIFITLGIVFNNLYNHRKVK